jgi:inosine-uridine nucleoside N-ribohydrolase
MFKSCFTGQDHVKKKVLIDTDPGVDDALALLMALNLGEVEILGLVSEPGNVPAEKGSANTVRLLDALEAPPSLYEGVHTGTRKPLVRELVTAEWVHGLDGLGDAGLPPPSRQPKGRGVYFIVEQLLSAGKGEVSLLCLGPLTNIALSVLLEPDVVERVREVVIMGGWFGLTPFSYGNITPVSEFNIYTDPEAARIVFESFEGKLRAVGLDVTMHPEAELTWDSWGRLRSSPSKVAKVAARILENPMKKFGGRFSPHDPLALTALLRPDLFTFREYAVTVSLAEGITRGQTIVERRYWLEEFKEAPEIGTYIRRPRIQVAVDVRAGEAVEYILGALSS